MKKKILSFALVIIFSMLLCSCSGNSPDKMFGVKLPSGEKLELYMNRDKVEEIMSSYEYDYNDHSHIYDYGFIKLAYTDGELSCLYSYGDNGVTFLNGLGFGSTDYEKYGFQLDGQHAGSIMNYKLVDGKYEQMGLINFSKIDEEYKEYIQVYIAIDKATKKIQAISTGDAYAIMGNMDE